MTDARHYLRWSAPNSEASRTLREVMRHEQGAVPSAERLAALVANAQRAVDGSAAVQSTPVGARAWTARLTRFGAAAITGAALLQLPSGEPSPRPKPAAPLHATPDSPDAPVSPPSRTTVTPQPIMPQPVLGPQTSSARHATGGEAHAARTATQKRPPTTRAPARSNAIEELSLLLAARRALVVPGEALVLLERHTREFPRSSFHEEREALAIEALAAAGKHGHAGLRARRFVTEFPNSAYRRRIEAVLATRF